VARIVSPIVSVVVVALVGAGVTYFKSSRRAACLRDTGGEPGPKLTGWTGRGGDACNPSSSETRVQSQPGPSVPHDMKKRRAGEGVQ
jgi:hypothetical protein